MRPDLRQRSELRLVQEFIAQTAVVDEAMLFIGWPAR